MSNPIRNLINFAACAALCVAFSSNLIADPTWTEQGNLLTIQGIWSGWTGIRWFGPVLADLDSDGDKELIVADASSVRVYAHTGGNPLFTIALNDQDDPQLDRGFRIKSTPAIGDVNGDGTPDIVVAASVNANYDPIIGGIQYNGETEDSWLMVYDGTNGNLIDNEHIDIPFMANAPVLADITVLDYDGNPSYEDGRMEIILAGHAYRVQGENPYFRYSSIAWSLRIYQLSAGNALVGLANPGNISYFENNIQLDENENDIIQFWTTTARNYQQIPAVGDMDGDGMKEIFFVWPFGYGCWTYNPQTDALSSNFNIQSLATPTSVDERGYFGCQPTICDLNNTGELRAMFPYNNGQGNTIIYSIDINNNNDGEWAGANGGESNDLRESVAAGDMQRDGTPDILFHTEGQNSDPIFVVNNDRVEMNVGDDDWPVTTNEAEHPKGVMFAVADLGYGAAGLLNAVAGATWRGSDLNVLSIDNGREDVDLDFTGDVHGYSVPTILNLDSDEEGVDHLEVVSSSFNANHTEMYVRIWELTGDAPEIGENDNELTHVEWSQFGNGPRHTGLYAQPYAGVLPSGTTYFRDRVILTADLYVSADAAFHTSYRDPCVIEFNENVELYLTDQYCWVGDVGINSPVLVGNGPNAVPTVVFPEDVVWPDLDPISVIIGDGGRVMIGSGASVTLDGWHFTGLGSGTGTALTADDADVTFTNCTFENYQSALDLDNCTGNFTGCTFTDMTGHAINLYDCLGSTSPDLTFDNCTVEGSTGAAVYMYNSNPLIKNCVFTGNGGGSLNTAIYAYNSSPKLRDNDISGNVKSGFNASGGGAPSFTTYNNLDPHRNRFADNCTYSHTVKSDWNWAQFIQQYPTYSTLDKGHNDFVSSNGDYLISIYGYGTYTLNAKYNYWSISGTLGSDDFYPTGKVSYGYADSSPNYIADYDAEEAAEALFVEAEMQADTGRFADAVELYMRVVSEHPQSNSALGSLSKVYQYGIGSGMSRAELSSYLNETAGQGATPLEVYADRLAKLSLIAGGGLEEAIEEYEAVLESDLAQPDSLYYAIDYTHALIAQARAGDGDLDAVETKSARIDLLSGKLNRLFAELNGVPLDGEDGLIPTTTAIESCYPNPFNSTTTIKYSVANEGRISLKVFDLSGREVASLRDEVVKAGHYSNSFRGDALASGVYLARLESEGQTVSMKVTLVK